MPKAEITIKVRAREDFVPVRSFLTIIESTLSILKDLEHARHFIPTEWKVSAASLRSPLTFTIGCDDPSGQELVREYLGVFEQTDKSEKFPPERWPQKTLESAKKIVSVLNDGVSQITLVSPGSEAISPTQRVAASVDYLLAPAYEDFATLEGQLETISVHGRTRFNIYDSLTRRAIACFFGPDKLDEALAAFNKRIAVSGNAKYSRLGQPISIAVDEIRYLKGGVKAEELKDIDITSGAESSKYVKGLRDGE